MITTASPSPSQERRKSGSGFGGGSFIHSHGTKVFMRPRLDGVQDAVAQARFNEKRWVWIQDDQNAYLPAHVVKEHGNNLVDVELENGLVKFVLLSQRNVIDIVLLNNRLRRRVQSLRSKCSL